MKWGFVLFTVLLLSSLGISATIYVPDHYGTIQGAINAAVSGDMVIVRSGTYAENIDFVGKAITVKSESGSKVTIIDGTRSGRVVSFLSGESVDSVLDGFLITNGIGGIECHQSSPIITNNTIQFNFAGLGNGGGIDCMYSSSPIITNNIIEYNMAHTAGGIACLYDSSPTIRQNSIQFNSSSSSAAGILCEDNSNPEIVNNVISGNSTDANTGGIKVRRASPTIEGNTISGNFAEGGGGGLVIEDQSSPIVHDNFITENSTSGSGGGILIFGTGLSTITDNTITDNYADEEGGGISCHSANSDIKGNTIAGNYAWSGGGILCEEAADPAIANNRLSNNIAFVGGGISCISGAAPTAVNNIVSRNVAFRSGGGFYCESASPELFNNTIVENSVTAQNGNLRGGGAIFCYEESSMVLANNILWDNYAFQGSEIWLGFNNEPPPTFTISHSVVLPDAGSIYIVSGSNYNVGSGMIYSNPLLAAPRESDFHITWTSPCRDAGDVSVVTEGLDFEGDPRVISGAVDIGVDEYYCHLYHTGDVFPGYPVDVKVVGFPTEPVTLFLGSGLVDPPYSTQHGKFWLQWPPLWQGNIGTVPASGIKVLSTTVPMGWISGSEHPFQALVGPWGGLDTKLTNPMILTVE